MTRNELSLLITQAHQRLGFIVDEDNATLYSLMRSTTPRRLERAIQTVADDDTCINAIERFDRLTELLRQPAVLAHR